jgi:hypothetical protein
LRRLSAVESPSFSLPITTSFLNVTIRAKPSIARAILSGRVQELKEFERDLALLIHTDLIFIDIVDRPGFAEPDTLGTPVAIITLDADPFNLVVQRCPKRTRDNTGLAPDAFVPVDHDSLILEVLVAGLRGAYFDTEGFLTILTGHGEVKTHVFPLDHLNA